MEQLEKCRPLSSVQNWLSKQQWVQSHFEIIFQYFHLISITSMKEYSKHYFMKCLEISPETIRVKFELES